MVEHEKERYMRVRLQVQASFLALLLVLVALVPAGSVLAQGIERINFPPGATSVNVSGNLDNGAA